MKRATTIAALLLVVTASLALASPASANHFDSLSYSTCREERTRQWTASSYPTHSHLAYVHPDWAYVEYHCCLDLYGLSHRWNFSGRWWNGATSSRNWSPVYSGDCP